MNTRTLDSRYLTHQQREWVIAEILDHEDQCGCSDEAMLTIEAHLRKSNNSALLAEYKNYFPAA